MASFHNPTEWTDQLRELMKKMTPGEPVPFSVLEDFLEFFNDPLRTWKIPFTVKEGGDDSANNDQLLRDSCFTEQVVLQETRRYLWGNFYRRLAGLNFEKGEVCTIQHTAFESGDEEVSNDEFPPHTVMFEACLDNEEHKFYRIWSVSLPKTPKFIYEDGESFTQYYEYAKAHILAIQDIVHSEEELYQIITAERDRHKGEPYATIAGQRDKAPSSVLYFYWGTEYFFSAELTLPEGPNFPHLCYNPHIYPYPVQYFKAANFRKFRYLTDQ